MVDKKNSNKKIIKMKKTILLLVIIVGFNTTFAQQFLEQRSSFQLSDWKFYKGDYAAANKPSVVIDENWEDVTVPHTWNAKDILNEGRNNYYRGVGWYRTALNLKTPEGDKRFFIRFEGVGLTAEVFVNGKFIGDHKGAYSAFSFDITPYLNLSGENLVAVRADNSIRHDVAPNGAALYPVFGGIYRPVTVFETSNVCISPLDYSSAGVYIKQNNVSDQSADISVETLVDYNPFIPEMKNDLKLFKPYFQKDESKIVDYYDNSPDSRKDDSGLLGEYFDNANCEGEPVFTKIDKSLNFNFDTGSPDPRIPVDNFSIRWTGSFTPPSSGMYKFELRSDDGSRLFLDGKEVIDNWKQQAPVRKSTEIELKANKKVKVKILYNDIAYGGLVSFDWKLLNVAVAEKKPETVWVNTVITDTEGNEIASQRKEESINFNSVISSTQDFNIQNPHLWNAKADPYLYTVNVTIEDALGNKLDRVSQPLGIRYFRVERDNGLFLNGEYLDFYGVCRHQDWEGIGNALTDEHHVADMEDIMEMGANGIRLGHYQHADIVHRFCNENGLILWAEIPVAPPHITNNVEAYVENTVTQMKELVKQNYNHPSILFWGIYDEVDMTTEHANLLNTTIKELDKQRLTTQAEFVEEVNGRIYETDIVAWNRYYGWYYGEFEQYGQWFEEMHEDHPDLIIGLGEFGAGGSISQQQENPSRPDSYSGHFYPEQYQSYYHENTWEQIKDRNDMWCKLIWIMYDFSWPGVYRGDRPSINQKGLITHDRKVKKDAFYFYKANWSDEPVLHITSSRNTERTDKNTAVKVYTNLDKVELWLNGKLVSTKKIKSDIHKIQWDNIILSPGRNQINVIGTKGNKQFTDACEWTLQ